MQEQARGMEKPLIELFQDSELHPTYRTHGHWLFLLPLHYVQTCIAVELTLRVLIQLLNTVTLFVEAVIAQVTVDDFVLDADVGRETDFAVGFKGVGEFAFGQDEIF